MTFERTPYFLKIMTTISVLTLWLLWPGLGHAQTNPTVEKTASPVSGLSVEHQQTTKEYRVLWPGHRIVTRWSPSLETW